MSRTATVVVVLGLVLAGCGTDASESAADPSPAVVTDGVPAEASRSATADSAPVVELSGLPPVRHRLSLPSLMRERWQPSRLQLGPVTERTDAYTRRQVSYSSSGLHITGVLLRPHGEGPHPGIVLNHGHIPPSEYATGDGLGREQDYLAREGFVVLHTDYRGHAGSDRGPEGDFRIGYTTDSINAVLALEREPYVDEDRMAMLGKSMGGGVTLNALVVHPDLLEAAVIYGSVSSSLVQNLRHFAGSKRPESLRRLYGRVGTPYRNPTWFADLSARNFFDRISAPLLIHHGTADGVCPVRWSRDTQRLLRRAGAPSRLVEHAGEHHTFEPHWRTSIARSVRFVRREF